MSTIGNIRVGKAQTTHSAAAHIEGVRQGNSPGAYEQQEGNLLDGRVDSRRSTGINPTARNPIDRKSPNLPPA